MIRPTDETEFIWIFFEKSAVIFRKIVYKIVKIFRYYLFGLRALNRFGWRRFLFTVPVAVLYVMYLNYIPIAAHYVMKTVPNYLEGKRLEGIVTATKLNIRQRPELDSVVLTTRKQGEKLYVRPFSEDDAWYVSNHPHGYVASRYIEISTLQWLQYYTLGKIKSLLMNHRSGIYTTFLIVAILWPILIVPFLVSYILMKFGRYEYDIDGW